MGYNALKPKTKLLVLSEDRCYFIDKLLPILSIMPKSAPSGFIRVDDIKGPSINQTVFEIVICSRLHSGSNRLPLTGLFQTTQLSEASQAALLSGHYNCFLQEIFAIVSEKKPRLLMIAACCEWLRAHGLLHPPLRFELGMMELLCFLVKQARLSGHDPQPHATIRNFFWQTVYPHFFIGSKLTQLSRQQFSRQSDCLEDIIMRQYLSFAKLLIRKYCTEPIDLANESLCNKISRQKIWHNLIDGYANQAHPLPSVTWVKASVNRRWSDLEFFSSHSVDLCDSREMRKIIDDHLQQCDQELKALSMQLIQTSPRASPSL